MGNPRARIDRDKVAALIAKGLTNRQIADRLGKSADTINGIRREIEDGKPKREDAA